MAMCPPVHGSDRILLREFDHETPLAAHLQYVTASHPQVIDPVANTSTAGKPAGNTRETRAP